LGEDTEGKAGGEEAGDAEYAGFNSGVEAGEFARSEEGEVVGVC
jgi:hypothetical protein